VRFTSPVPVGSKLRARINLKSADPIEPQGYQMTYAVVVEREGSDKPVCVAETIARRYA
jgi:acyl dehydratase